MFSIVSTASFTMLEVSSFLLDNSATTATAPITVITPATISPAGVGSARAPVQSPPKKIAIALKLSPEKSTKLIGSLLEIPYSIDTS